MEETENVGIFGQSAASLCQSVEERWLLDDLTLSRLTNLCIFLYNNRFPPQSLGESKVPTWCLTYACEIPPRAWVGDEPAQWERAVQRRWWEDSSPVHHGVPVEGHEENLTATSGTDRCKEYLEREKDRHGFRPVPSPTAAPLHWLPSS